MRDDHPLRVMLVENADLIPAQFKPLVNVYFTFIADAAGDVILDQMRHMQADLMAGNQDAAQQRVSNLCAQFGIGPGLAQMIFGQVVELLKENPVNV